MAAALQLARIGMLVFPLNGKFPAIKGGHGFHDATCGLEQVTEWWTDRPTANIGLRPAPGVVAVDIDVHHQGDIHLDEWLDGRDLPETLTVYSGANDGSRHLFYWMGITRPRRELVPGVDLKAYATGYTVAPPSVHRKSGACYRWANTLPVVDAPDWLIDKAKRTDPPPLPPGRSLRQLDEHCGRLAGLVRMVLEASRPITVGGQRITPGARNDTLNWAAYTGAKAGISTTVLTDALLGAAREVGLPDGEARRTIASGIRGAGA
jgi:hypothetical protein